MPSLRQPQQRNLAARMGRWSASHWKTAMFGWLALRRRRLRASAARSARSTSTRTRPGPGESGRTDRILDAGFKQPAGESVLIQSRSLRASDPAFTAAIEDVVARISKLEAVQNVRSPLDPATRARSRRTGTRRSSSSRSAATPTTAADKIDPVLDHGRRRAAGASASSSSASSATRARPTRSTRLFADDLGKAGLLSLPITLIILVVAFGALVAAGIPLLLALTAVFATFGLTSRCPARCCRSRRGRPRSCS